MSVPLRHFSLMARPLPPPLNGMALKNNIFCGASKTSEFYFSFIVKSLEEEKKTELHREAESFAKFRQYKRTFGKYGFPN